jgi:hypothetical protein
MMQNMVMPPVYSITLLPHPGFLSEGIQIHVFQPVEQFSLSPPSLPLSGLIHRFTAHMTAIGVTNISAQSAVNCWGHKPLKIPDESYQQHTNTTSTNYYSINAQPITLIQICSQQTE